MSKAQSVDAVEIRKKWDTKKSKRLKLSGRPSSDMENGQLRPQSELVNNVKLRLHDLAEVLALMHQIYHRHPELYGDSLLAYVGDKIVRGWPLKDFPFFSEKAAKHLADNGFSEDLTGKLLSEINDPTARNILRDLAYEHWTPISFFRDVIRQHEPIGRDVYYELLQHYYRVVWVLKSENGTLNKTNSYWRPIDTYNKFEINIVPHDGWAALRPK
jgi:hypothetical protein